MSPKVKTWMEQDGDYVTYTIQSKSLTAALGRATLLAEALGNQHEISLTHDVVTTKRGKTRHQIEVFVN